ncbi:MAG TPA: MgtC/SapB family protein [Vicinamibacterales bacterium]|nr:MgtC/SapB family protein [Vicinamibacterales bacterium]
MDAAALQAALSRFLGADGGSVLQALAALPLAAVLGTVLAFRPRRRGTPPRSSPVIQTQIILAVVGAVVMLIVGASLARAFGIVGAANLIRYRAKIDDPKDAVVMLSTLSLGLACGVQLYGLAIMATLFVLALLWAVESLEPEQRKTFDLSVATPDPPSQQRAIESILRRHRIKYELRSAGDKELMYEAEMPMDIRLDRVSDAILHLQPDEKQGETQVVWNEKNKK